MNRLVVVAFVFALGLSGCFTSGPQPLPPDVDNISVITSPDKNLKNAVIVAATRRRWTPTEIDASTIRCVLVQRAHRVVVDVKLLDANHYSIKMIESNIATAKLSQWVNNLQREIAHQAYIR